MTALQIKKEFISIAKAVNKTEGQLAKAIRDTLEATLTDEQLKEIKDTINENYSASFSKRILGTLNGFIKLRTAGRDISTALTIQSFRGLEEQHKAWKNENKEQQPTANVKVKTKSKKDIIQQEQAQPTEHKEAGLMAVAIETINKRDVLGVLESILEMVKALPSDGSGIDLDSIFHRLESIEDVIYNQITA
jgi:citrate lyase gamma subunit